MSEDIIEDSIVPDEGPIEEPAEPPVENPEDPSVEEPSTEGEIIDPPIEPEPQEPPVEEPPVEDEVIDTPVVPEPVFEPDPEPEPEDPTPPNIEEPGVEEDVIVISEPEPEPIPEPEPEPQPEFITQVFYEEVYTIPVDCVEVAPPPFYRPRWDGEQWVEEGVRPADPPHVPTPEEKIAAQEDQITMLEMALVDSFEQSLELQTQNELAMVEMYELMFG